VGHDAWVSDLGRDATHWVSAFFINPTHMDLVIFYLGAGTTQKVGAGTTQDPVGAGTTQGPVPLRHLRERAKNSLKRLLHPFPEVKVFKNRTTFVLMTDLRSSGGAKHILLHGPRSPGEDKASEMRKKRVKTLL